MTQLMEPTPTRRHAKAGRARLRVVSGRDVDGHRLRRRRRPDRPQASRRAETALRPDVSLQRRTALRRKIVPALAVAVIVMAYVYATVPFTFAGAVECRPRGVAGATAATGTPAGTIVGDVDKRCAEASGSRVATAGVTALLAAVVGVAGAVAPSRAEVGPRTSPPATPASAGLGV
jgi:hypothetical protein